MPTLQLPSVVIKGTDCELVLRLKSSLELEKGKAVSMAELIREALKELAAIRGVGYCEVSREQL